MEERMRARNFSKYSGVREREEKQMLGCLTKPVHSCRFPGFLSLHQVATWRHDKQVVIRKIISWKNFDICTQWIIKQEIWSLINIFSGAEEVYYFPLNAEKTMLELRVKYWSILCCICYARINVYFFHVYVFVMSVIKVHHITNMLVLKVFLFYSLPILLVKRFSRYNKCPQLLSYVYCP